MWLVVYHPYNSDRHIPYGLWENYEEAESWAGDFLFLNEGDGWYITQVRSVGIEQRRQTRRRGW